jgi:hypothetical protein
VTIGYSSIAIGDMVRLGDGITTTISKTKNLCYDVFDIQLIVDPTKILDVVDPRKYR